MAKSKTAVAEQSTETQTDVVDNSTVNTESDNTQLHQGSNDGQTEPVKTFTQDEVNRIVQQRLQQEKSKYTDYDSLKAQVTEFDNKYKSLEQQQSELLKTNRELQISNTLSKSAISQGITDIEALMKLADVSTLQFDEKGTVTNADEVIKGVIERYPNLVTKKRIPQVDAINPANTTVQNTQQTDAERRARYFGTGNRNAFAGGGVNWTSSDE